MKKSRSFPELPARGKGKSKPTDKFSAERNLPPVLPKTPNQSLYLEALRESDQVVTLGCAGTGKTYLAGTHAADRFRQHKIRKIYLTRPNVPAGRSIGFLPGTLEEKIAPWAVPLTEAMAERMGKAALEIALKSGDIEIVPFEIMRGRTFKNCIVILDEAQNTTPAEMKMFLSRVGEDCQVIINGDIAQSDLKETSGLHKIISMVKRRMMPVPVIEFTLDDIVRSGLCEMWVRAFEEAAI